MEKQKAKRTPIKNFYKKIEKNEVRSKVIFFVLTVICVATSLSINYVYTGAYNGNWFSYFTHLSNFITLAYFTSWMIFFIWRNKITERICTNVYFKMITYISIFVTAIVYWVILFIPILIGHIQEWPTGEEGTFTSWFFTSLGLHFIVPLCAWLDLRSFKYDKAMDKNIYYSSIWPLGYFVGSVIAVMYFDAYAVYPFMDFEKYPYFSWVAAVIAVPTFCLIIYWVKNMYMKNYKAPKKAIK